MALQDEIDKIKLSLMTHSYSLTIRELVSLCRDGELRQRFPRENSPWIEEEKAILIESMLVGFPLPSMFVLQDRDSGKWQTLGNHPVLDVVFPFMGICSDGSKIRCSPIVGETKILPSLHGKAWETKRVKTSLTTDQRWIILRTKVRVNILLDNGDGVATSFLAMLGL